MNLLLSNQQLSNALDMGMSTKSTSDSTMDSNSFPLQY